MTVDLPRLEGLLLKGKAPLAKAPPAIRANAEPGKAMPSESRANAHAGAAQ